MSRIALFLRWLSTLSLEHIILTTKVLAVEVLSAIVFFKWLLKAFIREMRK